MHRSSILALFLILSFAPRPAAAVDVDGTLDAAYGPALITQSNQTSLGGGQIGGDSNRGELDFANGSELDVAHAFLADGVLHLFLGGNLALVLNNNQNGTVHHILDVFIDAVPGGQGTVNGFGPSHALNGLTFDSGFEADYVFELEGDNNGFQGPREWTARKGTLPSPSGGTFVTLGVAAAGGPGTLLGGTNPDGILATIDNRNVGGVTEGCAAASGAGVTTGVEWAIPLAAIGVPTECLRIAAMVRNTSNLSNQVLAPLPTGTCPPGPLSTMDFGNFAGDQFFTVCPTPTGVSDPGGAGFTLALAGANPLRGDGLRATVTLPAAGPARLQVVDAAGRVWRERTIEGGAGAHAVDLSAGRRLAPGVYWVRLSQGSAVTARKVTVAW